MIQHYKKLNSERISVCNDSVWNNICYIINTDLIDFPIDSDSSSLNKNSELNKFTSDIDN